MRKHVIIISISIIIILSVASIYYFFFQEPEYITNMNNNGIGITRHLDALDFSRGEMKKLPEYSPASSIWKMDLRSYDLSNLNLEDRLKDLEFAHFDSKTKWPDALPDEFKPYEILENCKNPGLNIRELHREGIDGKGIGIAIIDQGLLIDHIEYREQLKLYEEIHSSDIVATMHGSAVSSIAVGKTVGVAPGADLYYISCSFGNVHRLRYNYNYIWVAQSIERIVEINNTILEDNKIRVIAISKGFEKYERGYKEIKNAIELAEKNGIFVVSCSLSDFYGFDFHGLGKTPQSDPDDYTSYKPGLWWEKKFYERPNYLRNTTLLFPMDSRTTASPTHTTDYVFYRNGGLSWTVPYIAGLYALACQVNPEIAPEQFWQKAIETGDSVMITHDGKEYELTKIVNPIKLIETIKAQQ
ncbi:S8 family serine peptidase [Alkaliphilus peptidifermentans]|uniref:Peptidase S8/S53 domain-containing protein n=1 Tax=Alkaliphilus peptidifermentans DSM 18978 TaxID=1120976 RepID=A0A1G5J0J1_9FIRM|nr:S8 family serine peptidase [Alkaliphilus peptidifermentans]SCY81856.1 hypothetical protein SAMN03080606_02597 [Alkaliphilus peptidifermentans DSM 18978]